MMHREWRTEWRRNGALPGRRGGQCAIAPFPPSPMGGNGVQEWRASPPEAENGAGNGAENGAPDVAATLSPCGTLAVVASCPHCAGQHTHGWSGDTKFDARPRTAPCGLGTYAIEGGG